jgi:dynein heavy chain
MLDFMEKSSSWTEDPILNENGEMQLNIESIRTEVDDYAARAYKMGKANKEVNLDAMCH